MKCLNCDNTAFEQKKVRIKTEYGNEPVEIVVPAFICKKCGKQLADSKQMNFMRQAAADTYRTKHHLLTSKEIIGFRKKLNMSQRRFAEYLDVGEASVKRWETYYAQERAMDEHIRLKSDSNYAEHNAFEVDIATQTTDEFSGGTEFSWEKFANVAIILLETCGSPLFTNKAIFYVDFLHFKKFGVGITGSRYAKLEYGPCPNNYKMLFAKMIEDGYIKESSGHDLKIIKDPDWGLFDDDEKETIKEIIKQTKKDQGKKLYDLSHSEAAYAKSSLFSLVNYKHAKTLRIG